MFVALGCADGSYSVCHIYVYLDRCTKICVCDFALMFDVALCASTNNTGTVVLLFGRLCKKHGAWLTCFL